MPSEADTNITPLSTLEAIICICSVYILPQSQQMMKPQTLTHALMQKYTVHADSHTHTHTLLSHTDPFSNHIHVSSSLFSYFGVHYRESSSLLPPFQTRCE